MEGQTLLTFRINERLESARSRNPAYSLRSLAKSLNLSASTLSEIRNSKRLISEKLARKVADSLLLEDEEKEEIVKAIKSKKTSKVSLSKEQELQREKISSQQFSIIADWVHFAILSLINTFDFKSDSAWIGSRLNISEAKALAAITRLLDVGLIELKDGNYKRTKKAIATSDEVINSAISASHNQGFELARTALKEIPINKRDFTASSFAIDEENIADVKTAIREFHNKISTIAENGKKDRVYRLNINFYPLDNKRELT